MIPAAAVEAAMDALFKAFRGDDGDNYVYVQQNAPDDYVLDGHVDLPSAVRAALEAAAPHMLADRRGEGDYMPGWDDRKTLASLWQEHAMLPVDGLSERVYDALIAVATWGYQRRKDEDL